MEALITDPTSSEQAAISREEAVRLGAVDGEFFARYFLSSTFRLPSPAMGMSIWAALDNPAMPFCNLQCFRGSAKTTRLRAFTLRRIAYGVSRTAMFIGGSEDAAARSIMWLRNQIERNTLLTETFQLRPGKKWHETQLEIISDLLGHSTWITGLGMTANIRGVNFDDYRPDLIVCDDVLTDENVLTLDARNKTADLLLGAVAGSLISRVEEPNAKLALAQTPLHLEDASMLAAKSEAWTTLRFPCWTLETEDLPNDYQQSSWPEMFPTEDLRQKKRDAAAIGKSHVFTREYEVRVIAPETTALRPALLQFYDPTDRLARGSTILAIDPVPPPSDAAVARGLQNRDFEAIVIVTRTQGNYYLRHYELSRGHNPSWTIAKVFELAKLYSINYIAVEEVAYQAVLKWLLETEMTRRSQFYSMLPVKTGRKSKYQRIVDTLQPLMALGKFYALRSHDELISQITNYPAVKNDDLLDAVVIALRALINPSVELAESDFAVIDESDYPTLKQGLRCP